MNTAILVGVDPGIVDTGAVWILLDKTKREFKVHQRVWRDVTRRVKGGIEVDQEFLNDLALWTEGQRTFVEGYRNRGRNPVQDQKMTTLVQAVHHALPNSKVVDNTGVKNVVTKPLLQLLQLDKWDVPTHHSDLTSAARIALKGAFQDDELNTLVSDLVGDALKGEPWTITKYRDL